MFYFIFEKSEDFSFGFRKIEEFDRKGKGRIKIAAVSATAIFLYSILTPCPF